MTPFTLKYGNHERTKLPAEDHNTIHTPLFIYEKFVNMRKIKIENSIFKEN